MHRTTAFMTCLLAAGLVTTAGAIMAVVVHAAGPFQGADYRVAELCLECGVHYLDVADARDFVANIGRLDDEARQCGLMIASGVSSTPAITSALILALAPEFSRIDTIHRVVARVPLSVATACGRRSARS